MKLLIVLTVIACGYAAKLDRSYLPPANAGTSGGSSGSLNTPFEPSGFGQPAAFGQFKVNAGFNEAAGKIPGAFGGQSGRNGLATHSNQYGQPDGSGSGQTAEANIDSGFGGPAQNFKNSQDYQRSQPQRAQASAEQSAQILRSDSQNDGETFSYSFETSNGISAEESGVATNGVQAQGAFAYSGDDGQMFRVQYTADENGYQPHGDHLPTSPPIPDEILKSIEENARAAASGTQEGAYNPNEEDNEVSYKQYNTNAPTSYKQVPTSQNGLSPAGKSSAQLYGAPNSGSRPQGPQSFSQQYNADFGASSSGPTRPSNGFGQPQVKSPSQLYGSPSNDAAKPSSFGQQRPSQQYSARPSGTSSFTPSSPQQYQASPSSQFPSAGRPQGPAQAKDASGYQYNKPQGGFGGNSNNEPNQQYRPQNRAPSGPQEFSRPTGNSFPSSGSGFQGSFGASPNSQNYLGTKTPSSFGSTSQTSYGASARPSSQSSFASSGHSGSGLKSPSSFGSNSQASYGSAASPNSGFSPSTGSQSSVGSSPIGFNRPQTLGSNAQGFSRSQGANSPMLNSGYEYNRPSGNSQFGGSPSQNGNAPFGGSSQNGFKSAGKGRPGQFGAPRAPPSFSEEEGYKY